MFSVGILYSAQEFLELIKTVPQIDLKFSEMFDTFSVASSEAILEVSQKCEWIQLDHNGHLFLTERGQMILREKQPEKALRIQLGHLIETYLPSWIPLLSRGRSEAKKYLLRDVIQCFTEAGLFDYPNDDIVAWWDRFSKISRKIGKDNKLELGRFGEKLSLNYERNRTLREPVWQGFETNLSGFDILSIVGKDDLRPLRIEVKSSNSSMATAIFHITQNEWNVACTSENYIFHLWTLQPKPNLKILNVEEVKSHIPQNQGKGLWENVSIPFPIY